MEKKHIEYIRQYLSSTLSMAGEIRESDISMVIDILESARKNRKQVFVCGNGGSAATASHFALSA